MSTLRLLPALPLLAGALLAASPAAAQQSAQEWLDQCRASGGRNGRVVHCEVRDLRLAARPSLSVSARPNGGVLVEGWERDEIRGEARLQAWAESAAEARALASQVSVRTEGGSVRASGPESRRERSWSVSYTLSVPRRTDLSLESTNGGLRVAGVQGRLDLTTTNGGIALQEVGGDVRGRTTNGGIDVRLGGTSWSGGGLDLQTTNGGVSLAVPEGYSAHLVASTVNGRLRTDFPITVQGSVGRRIEADLGRGGATLRLGTTNGAVRLERR